MSGNSFGQVFRISTFGESHGAALGVIIDGCPAGLEISESDIQTDLDRRKPGQSKLVTQRKEGDVAEILSGVFEGKTTGTPIAILIRNNNQKPKDYDHIKDKFRPSHADYTYEIKYGHRDYRGGGRSSARETAARVAAGAIAKKLLKQLGCEIRAYVNRVKDIAIPEDFILKDTAAIESNAVRCPDPETAVRMEELIKETRKAGDSVGGSVFCEILNPPKALGEPVFDKLNADLAKAMIGINAAQSFEYGSGFAGTFAYGSENNDAFYSKEDGSIGTKTNKSGGIQGGISNGERIYFTVGFKPVATLMKDQ
ncbi:MAG: chorismate synthase, partial [Luteibaculum sp.]